MGRRSKASKNNKRRLQRAKKRQLAKKMKGSQEYTQEGPDASAARSSDYCASQGDSHASLIDSSASRGVEKQVHVHDAGSNVDCLGEDKDVFIYDGGGRFYS